MVGIMDVLRAQTFSTIAWFKNNRLMFAAMFIWPYLMVGMILALGTLYGSVEEYSKKVEVSNPALYLLASSVVAMSSIGIVDGVAGFTLYNRWLGTLPYILMSPVRTPILLMVAGLPEALITSFITISAILPATLYFEGLIGVGKSFIVYGFIILGMLPMLGFSSLVASLLLIVKEESNILSSLIPFILLVSGVFYPLEILPRVLQLISRIVPTTYIINATKIVASYYTPEFKGILLIMYAIASLAIVYNLMSFTVLGKAEKAVKRGGAI